MSAERTETEADMADAAKQELSNEGPVEATARKAAARRQPPTAQERQHTVATKTHGKLRTPRAILEPGWVTLTEPIASIDQGEEHVLENVELLSIPSEAVRQVTVERL